MKSIQALSRRASSRFPTRDRCTPPVTSAPSRERVPSARMASATARTRQTAEQSTADRSGRNAGFDAAPTDSAGRASFNSDNGQEWNKPMESSQGASDSRSGQSSPREYAPTMSADYRRPRPAACPASRPRAIPSATTKPGQRRRRLLSHRPRQTAAPSRRRRTDDAAAGLQLGSEARSSWTVLLDSPKGVLDLRLVESARQCVISPSSNRKPHLTGEQRILHLASGCWRLAVETGLHQESVGRLRRFSAILVRLTERRFSIGSPVHAASNAALANGASAAVFFRLIVLFHVATNVGPPKRSEERAI